jgi:6-phosphofructo-2-kinase/fructose-2,6-biphosphatase 2
MQSQEIQGVERFRYCIATCGLPARGKTFIARKIARWLDWLGYTAKIFNVGNYRRQVVGAQKHHDFFDPNNAEYVAQREEIAQVCLKDMVHSLY